jgi:acyl carrier protein
MDNTTAKLTNCFALVFPKLDPSAIPLATAENVGEWDSIVQIRLLSVIGEEFGIDVDFEEFEGATSFQAILERLRQHGPRA